MPTIIGIDFDYVIIYQIKHLNKPVNIPYIYIYTHTHTYIYIYIYIIYIYIYHKYAGPFTATKLFLIKTFHQWKIFLCSLSWFLGIMSKETDLFIVKSKGRNIICISSATFFWIINNSYDGGSKCIISLMSFKKYYLSYNKMGIRCGMDGCS